MPEVHATSIVEDSVKLADDVVVGPQCVLQGRITLGSGTRLIHHVILQGPLTIGRNNLFQPNSCIGLTPQDRKFDPETEGAGTVIGDENIIREGVTIHRATGSRPTTVGNGNYLMCNSHVAHDCLVGDGVTMANGALLGGHVTVANGAILGGNAAVQQFGHIGRLAMLSGGAMVSQDVPPFCIVYTTKRIGSLNIIGLRRAGLGGHLRPLKRAFDLVFRSRLPRQAAVRHIMDELADDPLCVEFAEFVRDSARGITPYGGTRGERLSAPGDTAMPVDS